MIAFGNSQAANMLGYTPDELVSLPLDTIVSERLRQRHAERSTAYLARPVVRSMEGNLNLTALCKNGREVPVDISLSPIETAGGFPTLRARPEDIPLLVWHFVSKQQAKLGKRIEQISRCDDGATDRIPLAGQYSGTGKRVGAGHHPLARFELDRGTTSGGGRSESQRSRGRVWEHRQCVAASHAQRPSRVPLADQRPGSRRRTFGYQRQHTTLPNEKVRDPPTPLKQLVPHVPCHLVWQKRMFFS